MKREYTYDVSHNTYGSLSYKMSCYIDVNNWHVWDGIGMHYNRSKAVDEITTWKEDEIHGVEIGFIYTIDYYAYQQ